RPRNEPRRAPRSPAPALRITLGIDAERPQGEQPQDEQERPPRPAGEEAPSRRDDRRANQNAPAALLEPLREVEILHESQVAVAAEGVEHLRADEDPLVAVPVVREAITDAIDQIDRAQAPRALGETMLEGPAHDGRIGESGFDTRECVGRRNRVRVKEEERLTSRLRSA